MTAAATKRTSLAALLLCAAGLAHGEPAMLPPGAHAAWQAIGRLNRTGYRNLAMCTATLVAPQTVLTAAHCVQQADGTMIPPERLRFVAGWLRGSYAALGEVASVALPRAGGQRAVATDTAVLTLAAPMSGVAPLDTAPPEPGRPVRILGYRWDRPHALSDAGSCAFRPLGQGVLRLTCEATFGNSGGPVLQETAGGWRVVAVVSAIDAGGTLAAPLP
ncbi:serine protease [Mangrovicoccus sp. HB161399]|uniref:trypsin-like serine peptidase n=1 Tax=Mangrovicoccus sp. HB161399 TaxID=2720392 RepID=UPI001553AE1E|nr:serine protease [Mangrovicoccus sp. HB161399]